MKMNPKTKKTFTVFDEQSSPETKVHYYSDDNGDSGPAFREIGYCGFLAEPKKCTRIFDKVTCIECLWVVMQQGDHARDRLLVIQNLGG